MVIPRRQPHVNALADVMGISDEVTEGETEDDDGESAEGERESIARHGVERQKEAANDESRAEIAQPEEERERHEDAGGHGKQIIETWRAEAGERSRALAQFA